MSDGVAQQISLFRSQIENRRWWFFSPLNCFRFHSSLSIKQSKLSWFLCRFDGGTIRILESVLVTKDVKSLLEVRSKLIEFMRHEFLIVIHEIAEKSVEQKLSVIEFLVRAFALAGDVEAYHPSNLYILIAFYNLILIYKCLYFYWFALSF